MTQSRQHIALMESMGWTHHPKGQPPIIMEPCWVTRNGSAMAYLPDLTLDLMHEAEKTLDNDQWAVYMAWLVRVCDTRAAGASKEQRLEAYLRVKGLWVESSVS